MSLIGNVTSMTIIDCIGRKKVLNISLSIIVVSLILFGFRIPLEKMLSSIVFSKLLLIIYITYTIAYSLGMEIVPTVVIAEVFPIKYRGLGGGLAATAHWMANTITSTTIIPTIKLLGSSGTVLLFAGFSIVGILAVIQLVSETKGLSLEEIEEKS
jgi:MFS family permease